MSYLDLRDAYHSKFTHNLTELVSTLHKPFSRRSANDNDLIATTLERIPFFANYARSSDDSKELLSNLSSVLSCEHYPAMSVIHHHGDLAKKFMLILKGEARKYIPRDPQDIQNELDDIANAALNNPTNQNQNGSKAPGESNERKPTILLQNCGRSPRKNATTTTLRDISPSHRPNDNNQKNFQNSNTKVQADGEEVVKNYYQSSPAEIEFFTDLGMPKKYFVETALSFCRGKGALVGDYFGEIGLALNTLNNATLVAWEDVYVAVIEKKDYEQVFQEFIQETKDKVDFLTKTLLTGLNHKANIPFCLNFQKVIYRAGEKIFKQGLNPKGFWVIKEGEVELYRTIHYSEKNALGNLDDNTGRKKSHKALIVRLSKGQLLGEEMIVGMKERAFTAVGKSARNVLYFFEEKPFEQTDEPIDDVMAYLANHAKISMEGKMQRLNSSFLEAQIVLAQNENLSKTIEKNKAKDAIDDLLQGGKMTFEDSGKKIMTQLNSKKAARNSYNEKEAEEWVYFEKLAEVKQKVLMEKGKLDPKLLADKAVDEELKRIGYQENPERTNEMQIFEKKFYFPQSLYQQAVNSNAYMKKRREIIQFHFLKDRDSSKISQFNPASPGLQKKSFDIDIKNLNSSTTMSSSLDPSPLGSRRPDHKMYALSPSGRLNNVKLKPLDTSKNLSQQKSALIKGGDYMLGFSSPTSLAYELTTPSKSPDTFSKHLVLQSEKSQGTSTHSLSPTKFQKALEDMCLLDNRGTERPSIARNMEPKDGRASPREEVETYMTELKSSLHSYLSHAFGNKTKEEKEISSIKQSVLDRERGLKEKPVYGFAQLRKKDRKTQKVRTTFIPTIGEAYDDSQAKGNQHLNDDKEEASKLKLPLIGNNKWPETSRIAQDNSKERTKKKHLTEGARSHKRNDSMFT